MYQLIGFERNYKMSNYLNMKKEETIQRLQMITGEQFNDYRRELISIEKDNNFTYELIPFIEDIIDILLTGYEIKPDELCDWWKLYSETLEYNFEALKNAMRGFKSDVSDSLKIMFKVNIFQRILNWLKIRVNL
jgi:hypothetical protein